MGEVCRRSGTVVEVKKCEGGGRGQELQWYFALLDSISG